MYREGSYLKQRHMIEVCYVAVAQVGTILLLLIDFRVPKKLFWLLIYWWHSWLSIRKGIHPSIL